MHVDLNQVVDMICWWLVMPANFASSPVSMLHFINYFTPQKFKHGHMCVRTLSVKLVNHPSLYILGPGLIGLIIFSKHIVRTTVSKM